MEQEKQSFFTKIMSILFIAMGIFLGMYAFFANATTWTVGTTTWDNMNYLTSGFWNANPTSGDIITALYGSGDEWSAYTQGWTWYTSGSCLSGWMTVIYTWVLPETLSGHTIYVLSSGTYVLTAAHLIMSDCTTLITSWVVALSWGIFIANKSNIIIDNIWISNKPYGSYGLNIHDLFNFSIHWSNIYDNGYGISFTASSYWRITNTSIYNNSFDGLSLNNSTHILIDTIYTYKNNLDGINLVSSSWNILSGIISSGNTRYGVYIYSGKNNSINYSSIYQNILWWFLSLDSNNNIFTNIQSYTNTGNGISIQNSFWTLVQNSLISNNTDEWIEIFNSSWSIVSGCILSWNSRWIRLLSWFTNQIINSTVSNNEYGMSLQNSSGNIFNWMIVSGNIWQWIDLYNSNNNQIISSTLYNNNIFGISLNSSSMNNISWCFLSWHEQWISLTYSHNNSIINSNDYWFNGWNWYSSLYIWNSTWNIINNFSWNKMIYEIQDIGTFQYTIYDSYTQTNNFIYLEGNFSVTLTGNSLAIWSSFVPYFDELMILNYWSIDISGTNLWTINGSAWDGKIYWPVYVTTGVKKANLWETGTSLLTQIIDTIEVGATGTSILNISWWATIIRYSSNNGYSWQYLKILKSIDGEIWTTNTAQSACLLDLNHECSFITTWTLKLFALWVPWLFFTWATQSGTLIQSWGYYTTGITISFIGDNISGHTLNGVPYTGGTLITGDGNYVFVLSNTQGSTTGIIFTIDKTNPIVTGNLPASGTVFSTTSDVVFTWAGNDTNMSGYTLYITGTQIQNSTTTWTTTTVSLINGTYTWYVLATDRAGNTSTSTPATFSITTPFLPTITLLTGNLQYTTVRYTKDYASIYLRTNKLANYIFTGDFTTPTPPFIGTGLNGWLTGVFTLTSGDGQKNISLQTTDTTSTTGRTFTVYLDTTAPSIPVLTSPLSGAIASGAFSLMWSTATDTWVGLSGYQYFVSTTGTIGTWIIISWYTSSTITSTNIANMQLGTSGTFYRYIKAMDKLGNTSLSTIQPFSYTGIIDTVPDQFSLNTITSAMTDRIYGSNTITIAWLSANTPVLASISKWVLYISGNMVGTTGYVQNGWTVKIELVSSSDYDTPVSSTLTIWWWVSPSWLCINNSLWCIESTFRITTETEADANNSDITYDDITSTLSSTTKLQINAIFKALRDVYAGTKQNEFLTSFMIMLQSKIDDLWTSNSDVNERKALQYMYDLVDNYGGNNWTNTTTIPTISQIKNGVYTAPNGKKYTITYNSTNKQFTSPNFITPKYFVTWDSFKYFIDINNPAWSKYLNAKAIKARWWRIALDGTRQTSPYTAPNHKVFYFFKTMEGQFSSYTFTSEKYFDSLEAVKEYIHNSNK